MSTYGCTQGHPQTDCYPQGVDMRRVSRDGESIAQMLFHKFPQSRIGLQLSFLFRILHGQFLGTDLLACSFLSHSQQLPCKVEQKSRNARAGVCKGLGLPSAENTPNYAAALPFCLADRNKVAAGCPTPPDGGQKNRHIGENALFLSVRQPPSLRYLRSFVVKTPVMTSR